MQMTVAIIAAALVIIAAIWLFLIFPNPRLSRARAWNGTKFAHRGLHSADCAENSLKAFRRACEAGYGMELDVQFTADKRLVVFHDDDALRMTGVEGRIREKSFEEIRNMKLVTDGSSIPTFEEMLREVAGRQPLCIEIKTCPNIGELTRATVEALKDYDGPYVIESFNPLCLMHLRRIAPEIIRGQLVTNYKDNCAANGKPLSFVLTNLLLNFLARPDFVAYADSMRNSLAIRLQRSLFKTNLATWTITDEASARSLSEKGEMPIFENCRP